MKADYASHLLRSSLGFELFLFFYLLCALCLQNVNIYKTNLHLIDCNLLLFTVAILLRRTAWCSITQLQTLYQQWSKTKGWGGQHGWLPIEKAVVCVCAVLVGVWSAIELVRSTSLFNLLFLFYPLLLYLSLFGFTLEPRLHRSRFRSPKRFLEDLVGKKNKTAFFQYTLPPTFSSSLTPGDSAETSLALSPSHASAPQTLATDQVSQTDNETSQTGSPATLLLKAAANSKYSWEHILLVPAAPEMVRREVEILITDVLVRLKQLLFNSLFCAYYVGFIPMQFANSHLYFNRWGCIEHAFLVWATSFVILSTYLLPPSYCQLLFQCSLHLGCWVRVSHNEGNAVWSPHISWPNKSVVQLNGESFKAEGFQNVAIPCDTSQECFYMLFSSRHHIHTWLLAMQTVLLLLQLVILFRSLYWHQILSSSLLLSFSCYVYCVLLHNRIQCRRNLLLL